MKTTVLHDVHSELGARLVEFGGWHMPVQYGPILEEVQCVRGKVGLFDLGHMGRVCLKGAAAVELADKLCTNFVGRMKPGAIRYGLLCQENGDPIDDVLVYKGEDEVFIVVNASNTDRDLTWMRQHAEGLDVSIDDQTDALGMLALQGPLSETVLQKLCPNTPLSEVGYYKFTFGPIVLPDGTRMENVRISRTGYTGEDGFEVYLPQDQVVATWEALMAAGEPDGLRPIGLGARDTLRLEAGMPLYGHEIGEGLNPIEAGLEFGVSFHKKKEGTLGREALLATRENPKRKLMGLVTDGPRVPRQGYVLMSGDDEVGFVCSGSVSPTLDTNIGSAYVNLDHAEVDTALELDIRGKRQACKLVELPFYSRTRS